MLFSQTSSQLARQRRRCRCFGIGAVRLGLLAFTRRFLQIREGEIFKIRELVLRLAHVNRVQSPTINRRRQDLAWQFPEAALVLAVRYGENVPLLWGCLAAEIPSKKYDRLYAESIGLGIQDSVRQHAARRKQLAA